MDGRVKGATEQAVRMGPARLKSASRAPEANPSPFVSLQFSQALAIRSYTKFVMGVSRARGPFHGAGGLGEGWEASSGGWRQGSVKAAGTGWPCPLNPGPGWRWVGSLTLGSPCRLR